jgi:hypothetical protein
VSSGEVILWLGNAQFAVRVSALEMQSLIVIEELIGDFCPICRECVHLQRVVPAVFSSAQAVSSLVSLRELFDVI